MVTRMGEAHEIAARARRLPSWTVTKPRSLSGGYKIKAPDGHVVQVHLTSSDVNGMRHVLAEMNQHGFEVQEKQWEAQRSAEKAAELARQQKAANDRAATLVKQAGLARKAAGPYAAPEYVEKEWFTTKHPRPWHRWVIMTPDLATFLLDNHNTDNRPHKPKTVEHYRKVILSGQWHLTHQGMAMDTRAIVQDGQHRLMAIRESGVECPVSFYTGMPPENFKAIDEGLLRKAADLFGKDGEGYVSLLQAVVKLVGAFKDPVSARAAYHTKQTNESMYDAFKEDADDLRTSVRYGSQNYKKAKMNSTAVASAHYLIRRQNGKDNPYVEAFFNGLMSGFKGATRTALDEDDPRQKLRDYVENIRDSKNKRLNALDNLCLILIAWNQVTDNYKPKFARWADNMDIPGVQQCSPTGRYASAIPIALTGEIEHAQRGLAEVREMANA